LRFGPEYPPLFLEGIPPSKDVDVLLMGNFVGLHQVTNGWYDKNTLTTCAEQTWGDEKKREEARVMRLVRKSGQIDHREAK
jgi:hypothetical protein